MIDASIPLRGNNQQRQSQADILAKVLALAGANQQLSLGRLQEQQITRQMEAEDQTRTLLPQYLTGQVSLADLARASPAAYYKALDENRKRDKDQAEIDKNKAETRLKNIEAAHKKTERITTLLGSANDQTTYELALATAKREFPDNDWTTTPVQFDPIYVRQQLQQAMSAKDRLAQILEQEKFDFDKTYKNAQTDIARRGAAASEKQAQTSADRLELDRSLLDAPEGAAFKVRRRDTGEDVLVFRSRRGDILDANTKRKVDFEVEPEGPTLTPEGAGKLAMIKQGKLDVKRAHDLLFTDGKLKRLTAAEMRTPYSAGGWSDESREAFSTIRNAVAGKLRAETGTAAPPAEVEDIAKRFFPSPLDGDELASSKLKRLEEFFDLALDEMRRAGYISKSFYESTGKLDPKNADARDLRALAERMGGRKVSR